MNQTNMKQLNRTHEMKNQSVVATGFRKRASVYAGHNTLLYLVLLIMGVISFFPFVWMLSTSLKLPGDALVIPVRLLPNPLSMENYPELFRVLPFATFFANSVKTSFLVVLGQVMICAIGGYGFARLNFRGKNIAFAMLIGSMLMPVAVRIIPLYIFYRIIHWLDTHYPIVIAPVLSNTFGTFLFRQFFMTIPNELEDAATIDGCSAYRTFWSVMLPQAKPVVSTVAIFAFMHSWNNFLEPLIYLTRMNKFTIPIGLSFFQGAYTTQYTVLMAGATLAVVPILIVYFVAQDYFIKGIVTSGLKG